MEIKVDLISGGKTGPESMIIDQRSTQGYPLLNWALYIADEVADLWSKSASERTQDLGIRTPLE